MMTLAVPAFNAIRGGTDFTSELYEITGTIDQARAYAMSNNTFVLVGITEVSGLQGSSVTPQVSGTGRVAIAVIASKDGTRPYQALLDNAHSNTSPNIVSVSAASVTGSGGAYEAVTKLVTFANLHIVDLQSGVLPMATSGGMVRPTVTDYYDIGNNLNCVSATPFAWPIGSQINGTPAPQYSFGLRPGNYGIVIEFDPEGSARIITSAGSNGPLLDAIPQQIELALQPARGSTVTPVLSQENGQIAAIQIDGISGTVQIYRP
jgi:Tfp pilus assembly protein FimT